MHKWCINLNFSMTALTFGFKAKDFGNSWSSFCRELRARSAFDRCVLFPRLHRLCCKRLGLTWQSTADCGARGLWERDCLSFLAGWACSRGKKRLSGHII